MLINTMVETYRVFDEFSIEVPDVIKNSIIELRQKFDEMMTMVICCSIFDDRESMIFSDHCISVSINFIARSLLRRK